MTATVRGVGGRETTHVWNGFTFNDANASRRAMLDPGNPQGLRSRAEFADPRSQNTGRRGEHPIAAALGGKTVIYEGLIQARTLEDWQQTAREMAYACSFTNTNSLTIGGAYFTVGRIISVDIDGDPDDVDLHRWWTYQGKFSVSIRLDDGRMLALPLNLTQGHPSGATVNATNAGTAEADLGFAIHGVPNGGNVLLQNITRSLTLAFANLPAGDLSVDWYSRKATIGGSDVLGYLIPETSNWWDQYQVGLAANATEAITVNGGNTWDMSWYDTDA